MSGRSRKTGLGGGDALIWSAAGIDLCRAAGATINTMETVVFDWLRRAGTETFKHLSRRIR